MGEPSEAARNWWLSHPDLRHAYERISSGAAIGLGLHEHMAAIEAKRRELEGLLDAHARSVRRDALEELERMREERDRARRFVAQALECSAWVGSDLGGGDAQDLAEELGLIRKVRYDPSEHGDNEWGVEPGDPWFVLAWDPKALAQEDPPARAGEEETDADA